MQIKTIRKNIELKLDQWLQSITDESLRKDVRDNIVLSGGSITSMLLNTDVNDYDIYIQDKSVLLRLCHYYVDHTDAEVWDGENKEAIAHQTYLVDDWESKVASAYRNLKDNQVRIYIGSDSDVMKIGSAVEAVKEGEVPQYRLAYLSPNAISLTDNIQVVVRFYGTPEEIHKTFDFIHATNYFTFKDGLVTNIKALESVLEKQLHYQGSLYPLTSVIRAKKFIHRGWNINAGEYLKMMFQISLLDLTDIDILEDQLIGIDVAYFGKLIDALRDHKKRNKDFVPNAPYINSLIDRIFND